MSNVIKYNGDELKGDVGAFRGRAATFGLLTDGQPFARNSELAEIDRVKSELVALKKQQETILTQNALDIEAAYQKGLNAGKAAATKDEAAAQDLLAGGIENALAIFREKVDQLDQVALMAAMSVLEHFLSDTAQIRAVVTRNIEHQIKNLDRNMIISVQASSADFSNAQEVLNALGRDVANDLVFSTSNTLAPGSFHIELTLGHLEFSLAQSLGEVQSLVDELISQDGGQDA